MKHEEVFKYLSPTVQRTIDVLFVFMSDQVEWSLAELAQAVNLPKTTVFREVVNLEVRGLVEQDPTTGKYRLGLRLFELGMYAWRNVDLRAVARPYLEELSRRTGESITLGILSEDEVLYLDKVDSAKVLRAASSLGQRRLPHCTAVGKVLLADLSDYEVARIAQEKGLAPRTAATITNLDDLRTELARIRHEGYSVDLGEFEEGLCCVATPILDGAGKVAAAIGVAGPLVRFDAETRQQLIKVMQSTAEEISARLGYHNHPSVQA